MKHSVFLMVALLMGLPGLRLLLSSRGRSEATPERLLGLAFLAGAVAIPLRLFSVAQIALGPISTSVAALSALGHALLTLTVAALFLFTWRVFHPDSARVRAFVFLMIAALVANLGWQLAAGAHRFEAHPSVLISNLLRGSVFPWACFESHRYYRMMKRRAALGLANPVVTNRFALWTIWTGTLTALPVFVLAARLVARSRGAGLHPEVISMVLPALRVLTVAGLGVTCVCIWLSFFPTAAYARWLRGTSKAALSPAA